MVLANDNRRHGGQDRPLRLGRTCALRPVPRTQGGDFASDRRMERHPCKGLRVVLPADSPTHGAHRVRARDRRHGLERAGSAAPSPGSRTAPRDCRSGRRSAGMTRWPFTRRDPPDSGEEMSRQVCPLTGAVSTLVSGGSPDRSRGHAGGASRFRTARRGGPSWPGPGRRASPGWPGAGGNSPAATGPA